MKTQLWWCEVCGTLGAVRHIDRAGVMEVIHQQADQHREAVPDCPNNGFHLRSICPEFIEKPMVLTVKKCAAEAAGKDS